MRKTLTALAVVALLPAGAVLVYGGDCSASRDRRQLRDNVQLISIKAPNRHIR